MSQDTLPVIDRTYKLLKWFLGRLEKFPRAHRYGLGQRIEGRLYNVFEGLVRAKYAAAPAKSGWCEIPISHPLSRESLPANRTALLRR